MTTFFTPNRFLSTITYIYNFIAHVYYYSHTTDPKQHPYLSLNENIYAYRSPRTPVVQLAAVLIHTDIKQNKPKCVIFNYHTLRAFLYHVALWLHAVARSMPACASAAGTLLAISPYSLYFEALHNCMQPLHPRPSCSAATYTTPVSFRHFSLP